MTVDEASGPAAAVYFTTLFAGHWKYTRGVGEWRPAYLSAYVDGYRVTCTGNGPGWRCACETPECEHRLMVADFVHPRLLEMLEAEDDRPLRPPSQSRRTRRARARPDTLPSAPGPG